MARLKDSSASRSQRSASNAGIACRDNWQRWRGMIAALVVPPRCLACARMAAHDALVCETCRSLAARMSFGAVASPAGHDSSLGARFAAFPYEGIPLELVRALKFRGAVAAAREMAALMVERVPVGMLSGASLVPVPAHPRRRRERGFNQSALLAQEIAAVCELSVWDCLERVSGHAPQTGSSRARRLSMPSGAIRMKPGECQQTGSGLSADFPTKVVLLDDVATTGVTLEVCASAIRERYPADQNSARRLAIGAVTFAGTGAHPANIKLAQTH